MPSPNRPSSAQTFQQTWREALVVVQKLELVILMNTVLVAEQLSLAIVLALAMALGVCVGMDLAATMVSLFEASSSTT